MERKPPLRQKIQSAGIERHYLNYFNNYLLKEGLLTPDEHRNMQIRIVQRKRTTAPGQR